LSFQLDKSVCASLQVRLQLASLQVSSPKTMLQVARAQVQLAT
jgi:hypothetical protein